MVAIYPALTLFLSALAPFVAARSEYSVYLQQSEIDAMAAKGRIYTGVQARQTCTSDFDYTHNDSGRMGIKPVPTIKIERVNNVDVAYNVYKLTTNVCKKVSSGAYRRRACGFEIKFFDSNGRVYSCGTKKFGECGKSVCCGTPTPGFTRLDSVWFGGSDAEWIMRINPSNCPSFYN